MKDKINTEVKFRKAFRPYVLSANVEAKDDFLIQRLRHHSCLKYVNLVPETQSVFQVVTNEDIGVSLQTIHTELQPSYYDVFENLEKKKEVAFVLNTNYNIHREPLVDLLDDAISCFRSPGLDCLVICNYVFG